MLRSVWCTTVRTPYYDWFANDCSVKLQMKNKRHDYIESFFDHRCWYHAPPQQPLTCTHGPSISVFRCIDYLAGHNAVGCLQALAE